MTSTETTITTTAATRKTTSATTTTTVTTTTTTTAAAAGLSHLRRVDGAGVRSGFGPQQNCFFAQSVPDSDAHVGVHHFSRQHPHLLHRRRRRHQEDSTLERTRYGQDGRIEGHQGIVEEETRKRGWTDGQRDGRTHERTGERTNRRLKGWTGEEGERKDECRDGGGAME